MNYRNLKSGEIVKEGDEYMPFLSDGRYMPVAEHTIGQKLFECNEKYYRRPMTYEITKE